MFGVSRAIFMAASFLVHCQVLYPVLILTGKEEQTFISMYEIKNHDVFAMERSHLTHRNHFEYKGPADDIMFLAKEDRELLDKGLWLHLMLNPKEHSSLKIGVRSSVIIVGTNDTSDAYSFLRKYRSSKL